MQHTVAVVTGAALPQGAEVDAAEDGAVVAMESYVGTDERLTKNRE